MHFIWNKVQFNAFLCALIWSHIWQICHKVSQINVIFPAPDSQDNFIILLVHPVVCPKMLLVIPSLIQLSERQDSKTVSLVNVNITFTLVNITLSLVNFNITTMSHLCPGHLELPWSSIKEQAVGAKRHKIFGALHFLKLLLSWQMLIKIKTSISLPSIPLSKTILFSFSTVLKHFFSQWIKFSAGFCLVFILSNTHSYYPLHKVHLYHYMCWAQ